MKKAVILLTFLFVNFLNAQISFKTSFKDAQAHAKTEGKKYILIDFTATWCGPCKLMDKKVFSKADVGNYVNAKFAPAKIDVDTPEGKDLSSKYSIESIPTILIMDLSGKVIKRLEGLHTDKQFIQELEMIK